MCIYEDVCELGVMFRASYIYEKLYMRCGCVIIRNVGWVVMNM